MCCEFSMILNICNIIIYNLLITKFFYLFILQKKLRTSGESGVRLRGRLQTRGGGGGGGGRNLQNFTERNVPCTF